MGFSAPFSIPDKEHLYVVIGLHSNVDVSVTRCVHQNLPMSGGKNNVKYSGLKESKYFEDKKNGYLADAHPALARPARPLGVWGHHF